MTSNTTTKRGANTASSSGSESSSSNPKKDPKSKKQQSSTSTTTAIPKRATDPPLECTQSDFDALLGDAAGLVNYDEASSELLDCARYGTYIL